MHLSENIFHVYIRSLTLLLLRACIYILCVNYTLNV
jgi:hypothetical protein